MTQYRPKNWRPGRAASDRVRKIVFDVLIDVAQNDSYANLLLPKALKRGNFQKQDAAYATNLCYGTLRLQGRWDAIIATCTNGRKLTDIDIPVLVLLRMGAHQLLEFKTPAHAAIYETVTLARNELGSGASGFINAVLRRVSERTITQWRDHVRDISGGNYGSVQFLATWFSHPEWIVRALVNALKANGRSTKDIVSVLKADNIPAPVALVARDLKISDLQTDIEKGSMRHEPGKLMPQSLLLTNGDPARIFAVKDKLAGVQDEGSQLVAKIFTTAAVENEDKKWLDLCAGPGGKSATIAAIATQRSAHLYANELHSHRLDLVSQAVQPWSEIISLRTGDGRDIGIEEPESYDRILVDVPCTGIGALRRRPEARWRKNPSDAIDLQQLQIELLESAWNALKPGGVLVYSTCSPYLPETHEVIKQFLAEHPAAKLLDAPKIANSVAKIKFTSPTKMLQLWPDLHHSDAMFAAVIKK
ncbi:transcription antitermination factor NusB [Arcanobacterium hippocoleae]|uniref:16S rRNA (Cytosine967-C5)-methyltransferase n=1 Tax=Arcanobacterium hippocoleae TaxID=149017 RepID=A0ABU1T0E4_9ACTO|nr:transcription antitermination factor NusB [Arcanobacterium hippocoleae]MDR6938764.1 16S rRNA (cytosine967-C5)-methyltransferase [Arcanobacterium hippocoleae]